MTKTTKNGKATKRAAGTVKHAAIYVRVSSEKQAEKVSPEAQEADCQALAERQGYVVVKVYRDTEKYRVGGKMVEPSGTRSDRPGLRAMLADADAGKFDMILAWREDRLYRGVNRAMLEVSERVNDGKVTIELIKDHYDPGTAVIKAWAAGVELQAKSDRTAMGVGARLVQGKAWSSVIPYGYQVTDSFYALNEDEARWVKLVWQWFGDGLSVGAIRQRLIADGARQRGREKYPWSESVIREIVRYEPYHTGQFKIEWGSEAYTLPLPIIIDTEGAAKVKARLDQYHAYPAGHFKDDVLTAGLVYCKVCNARMSVWRTNNGSEYLYLRCQNCNVRHNHLPGCAKSVRAARVDTEVWDKLWTLISVPGKLEAAIEKRVTELQAQELDAEGECDKLTKQLDDLAMMRQEAIVLHQQRVITKVDLELRLTSLSFEQVEAERKLRDNSLLVGNRAAQLMEVARIYRERVTAGAQVIVDPQTPEEMEQAFQFKRKMIVGLVKRVDVLADKSTSATFELDFINSALAEDLCISEVLS